MLKKSINSMKKIIFPLFLLAGVVFVVMESAPLEANPEGGVVSAGNAVISTPASNTEGITQTTDKAVINWHSFNITSGEKTQVIQPFSFSILLNRIDPAQGVSQILGSLIANGQIWLINPAGIFFGAGTRIDVAGLLATTANITNSNNSFTGAVSLTNSNSNDVSLTAGSTPLILGASSIGQNLTPISGGGILQTGAITQTGAGAVTLTGNAGAITLTNSSNHFLGMVTLSNSGSNDASITNNDALQLGASTVGRQLTAVSTAGITLVGDTNQYF